MVIDQRFFEKNEGQVNRILKRCLLALILTGPIAAAARKGGWDDFTYWECFGLSLFFFLNYSLVKICEHVPKLHHAVRYLILFGIHMGVCYMAVKPGINLYLGYALVPALSCLYMNRYCTLYITEVCYGIMMISLYYRAGNEMAVSTQAYSQVEWFGALGIGLTIEYVLLFVVLSILVEQIQSSITLLQQRNQSMNLMQGQLVSGLANLLESRDEITGHHARRTSDYMQMIALRMRKLGYHKDELTDRNIRRFVTAAPLHDVGKIAIPDSVLKKAGSLTDEEYELIKSHTTEGAHLVEANLAGLTDKELYECIRDVAIGHHERFDGKGYPRGLSGEAIPLCARIMAAADTLDALLSERTYKKGMDIDEVLTIFREQSGSHFEPCIVEAVISLKDEIEEYQKKEQISELQEKAGQGNQENE